jgi:glycosyltransferase involved in cell wall biosynthesis
MTRESHPNLPSVCLVRVSPWGPSMHGGNLRSMQILEIVQKIVPHAKVITISHPRSAPLLQTAKAISRVPIVAPFVWRHQDPIRTLARAAWLEASLAKAALPLGSRIIFDADLVFGSALIVAANARKSPVLALTHNIESFVPTNWRHPNTSMQYLPLLKKEISWLSETDRIWSIGEFDRSLLELFGLSAPVLPYFPPHERYRELLAIRKERRLIDPTHVLILGTVGNPCTREGILEQFAFLREHDSLLRGARIVVAGYGTETLAKFAPAHVEVHGTRSWEEVKKLLISARALWVHQGPMTGALTRITEALISGTPVIANRWATIGLRPMVGLSDYERIEDVEPLLQSLGDDFQAPDFSQAERQFSDDLLKFAYA